MRLAAGGFFLCALRGRIVWARNVAFMNFRNFMNFLLYGARCAECGRFNTNVVQYFTYFLTLTLTLTSTLSLTMYFLLKAAQPCP